MAKPKLSEARWAQLRQLELNQRKTWELVGEAREGLARSISLLQQCEDAHRKAGHDYSSMAVLAIAELEG